ncbi:hypothetical protein ACFV9E_39845 [Streptomyces sp. NPDC059835]|uniref:hypothetical protein n=1 Tax=Streptomyces sp. NPDC059835 TaxID=3346967 RepID=UPI00365CE0FC
MPGTRVRGRRSRTGIAEREPSEAGHDASAWAPKARGTVPTCVAVALNTDVAIRRFAERDHNITHWTELERGGNFLALEQPGAFVTDVRTVFGTLAG